MPVGAGRNRRAANGGVAAAARGGKVVAMNRWQSVVKKATQGLFGTSIGGGGAGGGHTTNKLTRSV